MEEGRDLFGEKGSSESEGKKRGGVVTFKTDYQKQSWLMPPSLDDLVPQASIARFINEIVERLDTSGMEMKYVGGGSSAYHPKALLKIWLLGWCRRVYTSRPLAMSTCRDVEFMWISGLQQPTHATLNTFRKSLDKDIKIIFRETVKLAMEAGFIDGKDIFIDHTKQEADGNRYKITWKKNIDRWMEKVNADIDRFLQMVDRLTEEEERQYPEEGDREAAIKAVSPALVKALVDRVNAQMKAGEKDEEQGRAEKKLLREGLEKIGRKEGYERKLDELDGRNSMSNTDPDATAMMMKDGVSIKPGYNVGIATQNGIVTGFDVSNNSNDSVSFQAVLDDSNANVGCGPENLCADAGYGTQEIYGRLEDDEVEAFVKYPGWLRDEKGTRGPFETESFMHDEEQDTYRCPQGATLGFIGLEKRKNRRTGFEEEVRKYRADAAVCAICPRKGDCTKAEARTIQINVALRSHREKARSRLASDKGKELRSRRAIEVETVFGDKKRNQGFRRFNLRGTTGVTIECGLYYSAWNIRKLFKLFILYWRSSLRIPALPAPW